MAALFGGALGPAALASDSELRRQAFSSALAQESELYSRCGTAQVYQNKAARTCATDWDRPQYPTPAPAPAPAQHVKRPTAAPGVGKGGRADVGSRERTGSLAHIVPTNGEQPAVDAAATAAAAAAAAKKKKRTRVAVQLVEADLDWEGAAPDDGRDDAALVDARQSRPDVASQGGRGQTEGQQQQEHQQQQELASLAGQGQEQGVANMAGQQGQEKQRQLQQPDGVAAVAQETQSPSAPQSQGPPPTVLAAPPLATQLASVPGPALLTSSYQPSEAATAAQPASPAAAAAAAAGLERRTVDAGAGPPTCLEAVNTSSEDAEREGGPASGSGITDPWAPGSDTTAAAAAAAAVTSSAQHEQSRPPPGAADAPHAPAAAAAAPAGSADGGPAPGDWVRQVVELFIKAELDPLLRRGKLSPEVHHTILAKCSAKVLARHPGAGSADFLAAEGEGVRKLVARYVEYYTSS